MEISGQTLRYYRHTVNHMTQEDLAHKSGVTQSAILRIELGQRTNAKLSTITALAKALRIPAWRLVEDDDSFRVDPLTDALGRDVLMLSPEGRVAVEKYMRYVLKEEQEVKKGPKKLIVK